MNAPSADWEKCVSSVVDFVNTTEELSILREKKSTEHELYVRKFEEGLKYA